MMLLMTMMMNGRKMTPGICDGGSDVADGNEAETQEA